MQPSNGASAVKYATTCLIPSDLQNRAAPPCGATIHADPIGAIPIVGEPPILALQNFIKQNLLKHIMKKHPQVWQIIQANAEFYTGYMIAGSFRTEDPVLLDAIRKQRAALFMSSRRNVPTDADLKKIADGAGLYTPETLLSTLIELRDFCTEQGIYALKVPTPQTIG